MACSADISVYRADSGLDAAMIGIDRRVRGLIQPIPTQPIRVFQKQLESNQPSSRKP